MKAIWNGQTIAEAGESELISIEGNWYFPPASVKSTYFEASPTPYTCAWKGTCQYWSVKDHAKTSHDTAWTYPHPLPEALTRVGKDFSGYFAFWRDVKVIP